MDKKNAAKLNNTLERYGKLAIAYSGGTDSSLLAACAVKALGVENVLLFLIDSPLLPAAEREYAIKQAVDYGWNLDIIEVDPLANDEIRQNSELRCYYCKKALMQIIKTKAVSCGYENVADGVNIDDLGDYRPGLKASDELGIQHPLLVAGFGKKQIRELARGIKMANWNAPAAACLASRIPYGTALDRDHLNMIDAAETFLRLLGFIGCRVRMIAPGKAKIEPNPDDIDAVAFKREEIIKKFKAIGFKATLLDLEGYRQGSLNEDIVPATIR